MRARNVVRHVRMMTRQHVDDEALLMLTLIVR